MLSAEQIEDVVAYLTTLQRLSMSDARSRRDRAVLAAAAAGRGAALSSGAPGARRRPADGGAAIRKVVGEAASKGKVKLDLPPLVENGNTVPLTVAVESPMTATDYVKAIHVFTEKNPQPNVISFQLGPRAGRADVSTRIRLADTQTVDRDRRDERRHVLVGHGRRHRHARRLPGGSSDGRAHLINVPPKAKRGEIIEIKTLISHAMETGFRHTNAAS